MTTSPPSQLFPEYQNPTYPADKDLTDEQIAIKARQRTMVRAQSPGELICEMDGVSSWLSPEHMHSYDEFMAWRHSHTNEQGYIIADGEPWINWEPYDIWADKAPIPEPIPDLAEPPPTGWQPIYATRKTGIFYATTALESTGLYSYGIEVDANQRLRSDPALAIRVSMLISGNLYDLWIGTRTNQPGMATKLLPLNFKGKNDFVSTYPQYGGTGRPSVVVSDPISLDFRGGLHIAFYGWSGDAFGTSRQVPGWHEYYGAYGAGYRPAMLDKRPSGPYQWTEAGYPMSSAVFLIEALYPTVPDAIPMQVFKRYSLGPPDFGTAPPPTLYS